VILTHDRAEELARTLEHMRHLPEQPRVVVVDNASTDGTVARISRGHPEVEVIALDHNAGAAGRNAGVRRLDTRYVAFCDDDAWWAPGALARAADVLDADPGLAVVTGLVLVGPQERPDPTCAEMAASPLPARPGASGVPVLGFLASASMMRRSAFLDAGGYEARFFLGGEEELLALDLWAAGWWIAYVDGVRVHHHPSPRRDAGARRRLLVRNALWTAWLRRPFRTAVRRSLAILGEPRARGVRTGATLAALAGFGWTLRRRRVIPPDVEAMVRRLEDGPHEVVRAAVSA
jgi:GT2 family glycosyltransferase